MMWRTFELLPKKDLKQKRYISHVLPSFLMPELQIWEIKFVNVKKPI